MNYINNALLVLYLVLSTQSYSQDSTGVDPTLLLDSYKSGVSNLSEAYLFAVFVAQGDTTNSINTNTKFSIPDKEKQIKLLVDTLNSRLPVLSVENVSVLREKLDVVEGLLYETLRSLPSPMSSFAAESFRFSSKHIIDRTVFEYQAQPSEKAESASFSWWLEWAFLLGLLFTVTSVALLVFVRFENLKHLQQVAALVIATSTSGEHSTGQKN